MHSLRQRYGSNLLHAHAGPNMVVINPISAPSMYSEKVGSSVFYFFIYFLNACTSSESAWNGCAESWTSYFNCVKMSPISVLIFFPVQVMQMFKGCRKEDTAPHIYSLAQAAYRSLLTTRQDQSIVLLGKSGSGKTTNCQHIIQYLVTIAGSTNKSFSSKLERMYSNYALFVNYFLLSSSSYQHFNLVHCSRKMAGSVFNFGGFWKCFDFP